MTRSAVRVGRVSTRKGAVIHLELDLHGIADDHSRHVSRPVAHHHLVDAANLCRRCWTPARIKLAQRAITTATGTEVGAIRQLLARVVDSRKTPAEVAEDTDLAARIAATIQAAAPILARPADERPRTWATLRREFAATHPIAA